MVERKCIKDDRVLQEVQEKCKEIDRERPRKNQILIKMKNKNKKKGVFFKVSNYLVCTFEVLKKEIECYCNFQIVQKWNEYPTPKVKLILRLKKSLNN